MAFWNTKEIAPVTLDEFNEWIDDVIALTRLPNNDSMRFAVSTVVLEAKELLTKKQAALKLEKGAQNQFAAFLFQDIKAKRIAEDQAKADAEKALQASMDAKEPDVEATRSNEVAVNPEAPPSLPDEKAVLPDGSEKTPEV